MTPSSEINNHVIVYHDGSRKYITPEQADFIFKASCTEAKSITTQKLGLITFSAIAKILSLEDFYSQYPNEAPDLKQEWHEQEIKQMTEQDILNMRTGLLKGLKRFIDKQKSLGKNPISAIDIYENKIKKLMHSNQIPGMIAAQKN